MASPARTRATILAHHLYDFSECEHRIALDVMLDRGKRTPPDEAMAMLFEHGLRFEREIVEPLGYAAVDVQYGDWEDAFARTLALMREGVAGIDQGVLLEGARLARPDLLERVSGASALGDFHYVPGDVKAARTTRSDAVFQVGFAAVVLEKIQGLRPRAGFLILGDGRRESIDLEAVSFTIDDAIARAEEIALGGVATAPFYSAACARCRWRGECLPGLEDRRDLSFVYGVTRARRNALARHGVTTIDALADADVDALVAAGVPSDGLLRMKAQADVLLHGHVHRRQAAALPRGAQRELYLRMEADPLDRGEAFSIAWGEAAPRGAIGVKRVAIVSSFEERAEGLRALLESFESTASCREPIYVFGAGTAAAFDALAEAQQIDPARAGDVAGRFVDLAPWVRRTAVLPVFHYRFDEVAAIARQLPRPMAGEAEDALFVLHAGMRGSEDRESTRRRLEEAGRDGLDALQAIRAWFAS